MTTTQPLKFLYALTIYLFILELLYLFNFFSELPYAELLITHTKSLSLTLELAVVYFVYFFQSWQLMTLFFLPLILLNKPLRMKLRYLKQREIELEASEKANGDSVSSNAYPILFFLLLLNGMVFNREEGTSVVAGALMQYRALYSAHVWVLLGMFVLMVSWGVFCCIRGALGSESAVPDCADLEKGLSDPSTLADLTIIDKSLMLVTMSGIISWLL